MCAPLRHIFYVFVNLCLAVKKFDFSDIQKEREREKLNANRKLTNSSKIGQFETSNFDMPCFKLCQETKKKLQTHKKYRRFVGREKKNEKKNGNFFLALS